MKLTSLTPLHLSSSAINFVIILQERSKHFIISTLLNAVTMARTIAAIAIATLVAVAAYLYNLNLTYNSGWEPVYFPPDAPHDWPRIANINSTLGPDLSAGAKIHRAGSAGFNSSTERWNSYITPTFGVVVEVATEADVQATIRWANSAALPFLTITGGHGVVQSLNSFTHGVGIWMRGMKDVKILQGGEKARIEGGALSGELVHALWEEGKMAGE